MVIWLRNAHDEGSCEQGRGAVGVDGDIVRRETFARLVELDEGHAMLTDLRHDVLATARDDAARIVAAAQREADEIRERALLEFETGQRRGYEAGRQDALAQWYSETAEWLVRRHDLETSLRQRMADIVVLAVENIVASERPEALLARAADAVERIVDAGCHLRVRVHPDQRERAAQAFGHAAAGWHERGRPVTVTVIADRALEHGACVCETDIGLIDASLSAQIDAVRLAVTRALERTGDVDTHGRSARSSGDEAPTVDTPVDEAAIDDAPMPGDKTLDFADGMSQCLSDLHPDTEQEFA